MPIAWSRTSQPWQYGQCSTSRPQRSASPGTLGQLVDQAGGHQQPVRLDGGPVLEDDAEAAGVQRLGRHDVALDDLAAVPGHLRAARGQQLARAGRPHGAR